MKKELLYYALPLFVLPIFARDSSAATVTVGPHGQYPTPCAAFANLRDGDTVLIDANHAVPYQEPPDPNHGGRSDCKIVNNYLTIRGVNGRPIMDAMGEYIQKAIWVLDGHDIRIDNFEFRNAATPPGEGDNGAAMRIEAGSNDMPNGGNITVERCYIHDNQDGILGNNAGVGIGSWYSPNPYITFRYDDFYHNGAGNGSTHNMYLGFGGNMHFTLEYSKSRDAVVGHAIKTRAPYNYIRYNIISDSAGATSYLLNFPLGGTTYVKGNFLYKAAVTNPDANENPMIYRDVFDNGPADPVYGPPNEDLHFLNNFFVDGNPSSSNAYVIVSCANPDSTTCPAPSNGAVLTTPAEIKNNVFVGFATQVTNQPDAILENNVILPITVLDRIKLPALPE